VDTSRLVALLNVSALVTIMLSMGLQVTFEDVLLSARRARQLLLGLFANYLLVPAVTLGLLCVFQANPMVSVGLLILAACPGAPVGPPITAIARGDVPWSIGMMLILAGLSAILSPALLSVLLARIAPDSSLHINYLAIVQTLLITQLLPLAIGLGIHHVARRLSQAIVTPVDLLGKALLLSLVGMLVITQYESLAAIHLRGWMGMGLLLAASLGIGWFCGGPDVRTRKALAATTASRNVAVGLIIVARNFAATPAVTAVVAYGLISIVGALGWAWLIGRFAAIKPNSAHATS
jgi:BASS family bile acid:Na+ symporter